MSANPLKTALLRFALVFSLIGNAWAGSLKIIHLGPNHPLEFKIDKEDGEGVFSLEFGANSGFGALPESGVSISVIGEVAPALEIPEGDGSRLAFLHDSAGKFVWTVVDASRSEKHWSLRILNLSGIPMSASVAGNEYVLREGATANVPVKNLKKFKVSTAGGTAAEYSGEEPCSITAVFYSVDSKLRIIFVTG